MSSVETRKRIRIDVIDTGIGMTRESVDRIFAPFVQADASTARRFGGTGLGLAITKRLVDAMGGTIAIDSRPGAGTRATIDLALAMAAPAGGTNVAPTVQSRSPLSILLAEDNAINRTLIETLVRREGHSIRSVENGRQAVEIAAQEPFDLILMDIQMPEMDGLEATRTIRAQDGPCRGTPIVALTADIVDTRRDRYRSAAFSDLLAKPIDPSAFGEQLVRLAPASGPTPRLMPSDTVSDAFIDERKLRRVHQAIGDAQFDEIVAMMRSELKTRPALIAQLVAAGQNAQATVEAHAFRGAMAGVGASRVAMLAGRLECDCASGERADDLARQLVDDAAQTLDRLDTVAARIRARP